MKTMMKALESIEEFEELCNQEKITVFVFSADWCPDCLFIKPFLPRLIDKYHDYRFIYVDRDAFVDIAKDLKVMGIPSFIAFSSETELGRFVSKLRKTEKEIDDFLHSLRLK